MIYTSFYGGKALFVSNDIKNGDDRHWFTLQKDEHGNYQIYNPSTQKYIFPSNDVDGSDNIVEAKGSIDGPRFGFTFEPVPGTDCYMIYNPTVQKYLFVSVTETGGDNWVELHGPEDRSVVQLLVTFKQG